MSSLMFVLASGQQITTDLIVKLREELKIKIFMCSYGSTESNGGTTHTLLTHEFNPNLYKKSVGKLAPFFEGKIVDPKTGLVVPHDVPGELHLRSFSVIKSYWRDEAKTKEVIDAAGWYNTGDYFSMVKINYFL